MAVAGDWHGNSAWATRAIEKMSRLLPESGPRIIVHLGDFGIWPGPAGQAYLSRLEAALQDATAELWFVDGNHEDFSQLARLRPGPDGASRSANGSGTCPAATAGAGASGTGSPSAARSASTARTGPPAPTGGPTRRSPCARPRRSSKPDPPT
ncbi:MAG: metallophosphoesterase [Actinomycetota bacterium]|nr:metallophosphoesterase [Actinomycetota bacterium]